MRKNKYKVGNLVVIDPYNIAINNNNYGIITGIILRVGIFNCDVLSLQTMEVFKISKRVIYDIQNIYSSKTDEITIHRDTKPLFYYEEINLLKKLKESLDLNTNDSELLDRILQKTESQLISESCIQLIEKSKLDNDLMDKINTLVNCQCKDSVYENISDAVKIHENFLEIYQYFDSNFINYFLGKLSDTVGEIIGDFYENDPSDEDIERLINYTIDIVPTGSISLYLSLLVSTVAIEYDKLDCIYNTICKNPNIPLESKNQILNLIKQIQKQDYSDLEVDLEDGDY